MVKHVFIAPTLKINIRSIGIFLLFILSHASNSQVFYSTKPDYLKIKSESNNLVNDYRIAYPDTSITDIHNYFPRNFLGNAGLPSPDYILNYKQTDLGFRLYPSPLLNDQFTVKNVEYYRTKGPYADITGITGSKQLQAMKFLFTHTYQDKFNVTLRLNRYVSPGFYLKQQTFTNNFYLSSNFVNKNKRVGYYFYFLNNGTKAKENGGIVGDTISESNIKVNKAGFPVKLTDATRQNKEYKVMFNPWIKLNSAADSLNKLNVYLQTKSQFNTNLYQYKDNGIAYDGFYYLTYLDTVKTNDSIHVMQIVNEANLTLLQGNKSFGLSAGYKNEINRLWQHYDSVFMNHIVQADVVFRKNVGKYDSIKKTSNNFENHLNVQYIVSGANTGNYKVENRFEFNTRGKYKTNVYLNLSAEKRNADYIYNNWVSNHFGWFNNGYKAQEMQQAQLGVSINKKIGASVLFQNTLNYLFFDDLALPRQYAGNIQNIGFTVFYSQVFFKHLGISLHNTVQSTSHDSYVSIPKNIATAKLFFTGNYYKGNLQLNFGVQGQMYQSFYGYSYMPATQIFYLQDRRMTGDYPFVDIYLNARIRPVSVFVKVENALYGFAGTNYSFVPGYFQPDRAIRLGITWMFFD